MNTARVEEGENGCAEVSLYHVGDVGLEVREKGLWMGV